MAMGVSGPFEAWFVKGAGYTYSIELAGIGTILQGYDTKVAWSVDGMRGPRLLSGGDQKYKQNTKMLLMQNFQLNIPIRKRLEWKNALVKMLISSRQQKTERMNPRRFSFQRAVVC